MSLTALVVVVVFGACFGIRNCRNYKKLVQHTSENIQIGEFASISSCFGIVWQKWIERSFLSWRFDVNRRAEIQIPAEDFAHLELPIKATLSSKQYWFIFSRNTGCPSVKRCFRLLQFQEPRMGAKHASSKSTSAELWNFHRLHWLRNWSLHREEYSERYLRQQKDNICAVKRLFKELLCPFRTQPSSGSWKANRSSSLSHFVREM